MCLIIIKEHIRIKFGLRLRTSKGWLSILINKIWFN